MFPRPSYGNLTRDLKAPRQRIHSSRMHSYFVWQFCVSCVGFLPLQIWGLKGPRLLMMACRPIYVLMCPLKMPWNPESISKTSEPVDPELTDFELFRDRCLRADGQDLQGDFWEDVTCHQLSCPIAPAPPSPICEFPGHHPRRRCLRSSGISTASMSSRLDSTMLG